MYVTVEGQTWVFIYTAIVDINATINRDFVNLAADYLKIILEIGVINGRWKLQNFMKLNLRNSDTNMLKM